MKYAPLLSCCLLGVAVLVRMLVGVLTGARLARLAVRLLAVCMLMRVSVCVSVRVLPVARPARLAVIVMLVLMRVR